MMNTRLYCIICVLISAAVTTPILGQSPNQDKDLTMLAAQEQPLPEVDQFIGYDAYNHLYWIDQNTLYKTGAQGDFEYQELLLGPITQVNLQNPLTILVFYRDMNTVVFLDNRLNEKKRIDFNLIPEFPQVRWVYNAGSNRLWLFDQNSQSLWIYDLQKRQVDIQSPPLADLTELKCQFNNCLAQTREELIWLSLYGTITKRQKISTGNLMAFNGDHILMTHKNKLFDLRSNQHLHFPEIQPENQINDLQLTQDFLYLYDSKLVRRYPLNSIKK